MNRDEAFTSSQKNKGTSWQNVSGSIQTANTKQKIVVSSSKSSNHSSAKKSWESAAVGSIAGTAAGAFRRITPGQE